MLRPSPIPNSHCEGVLNFLSRADWSLRLSLRGSRRTRGVRIDNGRQSLADEPSGALPLHHRPVNTSLIRPSRRHSEWKAEGRRVRARQGAGSPRSETGESVPCAFLPLLGDQFQVFLGAREFRLVFHLPANGVDPTALFVAVTVVLNDFPDDSGPAVFRTRRVPEFA